MNDDLQRLKKITPVVGAAAFAYALAFSCSAQVAAIGGTIVGLTLTNKLDVFQDRFKSDVERILEPSKPTIEVLVQVGIFCLAVTAALALVIAPAFASPLGLLVGAAVASKYLMK